MSRTLGRVDCFLIEHVGLVLSSDVEIVIPIISAVFVAHVRMGKLNVMTMRARVVYYGRHYGNRKKMIDHFITIIVMPVVVSTQFFEVCFSTRPYQPLCL